MSVLPFPQACEVVQQYCRKLQPPAQELVSLSDALGRVLAESVPADRDFPPFPRATRDGFALRAEDIQNVPTVLRIVGQVKAGAQFESTVDAGQALRIMTGAPVPPGADAVTMIECTEANDDWVTILRRPEPGDNIVPQGSEARAGDEMLPVGSGIGYAQIAVAAAVGKAALRVFVRPQVAILATGDELVDLAAVPASHQIRNSNTYSLAAQVTASGGRPCLLPIAPDDKQELRKLTEQGLRADLLLLSGGVSMGEFDLVEAVLTDLSAKFFFTGVEIQPGRPLVFGDVGGEIGGEIGGEAGATPFFGLPGNPISTMVTFDLFVRPLLQAMSGAVPVRLPVAKARLAKTVKTRTGLTRFLPAWLRGGLDDPEVELLPWMGSGDISASSRANCYLVVPPDREIMAEGEMVSILLRLS
jgi:molybdopterin molybdotransferase